MGHLRSNFAGGGYLTGGPAVFDWGGDLKRFKPILEKALEYDEEATMPDFKRVIGVLARVFVARVQVRLFYIISSALFLCPLLYRVSRVQIK